MAIANIDSLRQRIADDAIIRAATPEQKATLLANWMLSDSGKLLVPDYKPPIIALLPALVGDCSHVALPFSDDAPVICSSCKQQVGTVNGLATSTKNHFAHAGCEFTWHEPPWFVTEGFNAIAAAAFPKNGRDKTALLSHYIIMEFIKNGQRKRNRYAAQSSANGFEFISSLSCNQPNEQVSSHDDAGRDELSAAGSSNQLSLV